MDSIIIIIIIIIISSRIRWVYYSYYRSSSQHTCRILSLAEKRQNLDTFCFISEMFSCLNHLS